MAIKLQIESISLKLKEHITTVRGKKVSEFINKTLKVKKLKYPLNAWFKTFYFEELTKTDRELYEASREAELWSHSAVEGISGGRGGHLLSGRKMN